MAKTDSQDNSITGGIFTLLAFILYYMFLKPILTVEVLNSEDKYASHISHSYIMMAVLLGIVITIHLILNTVGFQSKCGGNLANNFGKVFMSTFFPWVIIFGAMLTVLIIFPGFKGAFSNVIGYYVVANSANKILSTLLGNPEVDADAANDAGDAATDNAPKLASTADALRKLMGNTSIMINEITPSNFVKFWDMLIPIMKKEYQTPGAAVELKTQLLESVILRDNIGEVCWFIYTSVLLFIVVKSNLVKLECVTTLGDLKEKSDEYDKKKEAADIEIKKRTSTVYKG